MADDTKAVKSANRAWAFAFVYCLAGGAFALWGSISTVPFEPPFHLPWYFFVAAFALAERFTVDLEVRREAHTLSFTEIVTAVGLVFAVPSHLVLARVLTGMVILAVYRRPQPVKFVFNSGGFAMDIGLSLVVYHVLIGAASPIKPAGWAAALLAIALAHIVGAAAVSAVMWLAGAPVTLRSQAVVVAVSFSAAMSGTAVALGAASVLWLERSSWVLLALIAAALAYFFVSFVRIRERHRDLASLHGFTSTLMERSDTQALPEAVALGIAEVLKANRVVLFIPSGDEIMRVDVSPGRSDVDHVHGVQALDWISAVSLMGDAPPAREVPLSIAGITADSEDLLTARLPLPDGAGLILVDGRESVARGFDSEDLQLLETAASHAAAALQNAHLVDKLRDEARFRAHQALHDDVTNLPNQRALAETVSEQLFTGTRLVMLTVRIHSLREVNETLGRPVGDEMLRQVAARLLPIARPAWCARSGTDEFTLVVPGGQEDADLTADQIVEAFAQPVLCNDVALAVTVGVGVALAPQHGTEAEILLRRASLAASRSALDGTTVTTWAADRDPYDPQRLTIAADLRDAIPNDELLVHFQPQLDLATGMITSAEALVRWNHPRLGYLRPDKFIAAAEHTGAIDTLTYYVLEAAASTGARWHDLGWDLDMSVNLSARNLTNPNFADGVAGILERTGLPAASLVLELTESSVMTEAERALRTLHELNALGIALSIDDFGTGYSSLAHLRRLPVGEIKIDKSFVFDLTTSESDEAIVRSMVDLGHNLGLTVVVEGVETVEVRNRLQELGSDRLQGYLLSRPLAADAFEAWVSDRPKRPVRPQRDIGRVVNFDRHR